MNSKSDIVIIGGGVIGMSLAYELGRRGAKVTVIDKGEPGFGCSYGNAGWITPCFAMPLPMPGLLLKSIGWLLDPESPLYIKPEPHLGLLRWLTRFLMSMNSKQAKESVRALIELSKFSLEAYEKLSEETNSDVFFRRKGLLMVAQSKSGFRSAIQEMEWVAPHGIPGKAMNADEIRSFEPSLTGKVEGGVYFPNEAHAEPLAVVKALLEGARKHGVQVISKAEVFEFQKTSGKIDLIRTTRGDLKADQFVLATGSWSPEVAKSLGLRIPILGGKGYAVIAPPLAIQPLRPMMLLEKKVAITPREGTIRIAGTLELVNGDESITPRRVNALLRGAREFLDVPHELKIQEIWRGLRPCTPDGVPIIGYAPNYSNLFLATGHQMLGLQSAPGSARLAADLILRKDPAFDPHPFRADRF